MLNIGHIHRCEYELTQDRSIPISIGQSPGRIHFLGEHGESEAGFFLSAAINRYINVAVSPRKDNSFRFFAADLKERKRNSLTNLKYRREDRWANHFKPAILVFINMGYPMKGLNFTFGGDIPQQITLASSTAIEVATVVALRKLLNVKINDLELAQKLKEASDNLFGKTTSIADYLTCLMSRKDQFLLINCSEYETKLVKSRLSGYNILFIDSRVPRIGSGAEGEMASRYNDILKGIELLSQKRTGAKFKDFAPEDLIEELGNFPEEIRRRSMHIVEEIHRVNDAVSTLERGDIAAFSRIIFHSHESLRDLYEISCPEIDWLVKRAQELEGTAGARMTGLGFGGCTYAIIRKELAEEYKKRLEDYERIFGFRPVIYEFKLAGRAKIVKDET